jgi:hypothetical protein
MKILNPTINAILIPSFNSNNLDPLPRSMLVLEYVIEFWRITRP